MPAPWLPPFGNRRGRYKEVGKKVPQGALSGTSLTALFLPCEFLLVQKHRLVSRNLPMHVSAKPKRDRLVARQAVDACPLGSRLLEIGECAKRPANAALLSSEFRQSRNSTGERLAESQSARQVEHLFRRSDTADTPLFPKALKQHPSIHRLAL